MDNIKLSHSICICKFVGKNVFVLYWVSKNYTWSRLFCIFLVVFSLSIMTRMCRALISLILTLTQRVSSRPSDTNVINMQLISKCSFHGHRAYYLNYTLLQYVDKKWLVCLLFHIWVNFMLLQHLIAYSINKWNTDGICLCLWKVRVQPFIFISHSQRWLQKKKKKRQNFNYSIWKQNTSSVHLAVFRFLNLMKTVFFPTFSIFNKFFLQNLVKVSRFSLCYTSSWING